MKTIICLVLLIANEKITYENFMDTNSGKSDGTVALRMFFC